MDTIHTQGPKGQSFPFSSPASAPASALSEFAGEGVFLTCALPYANGPLHLGHLLEQIQADIRSRWLRSQGVACLFASADDQHGAPISIRARQEGVSELDWVARSREEHLADSEAFGVRFDHYGGTHSAEGERLARAVFLLARDQGLAVLRPTAVWLEADSGLPLADRHLLGSCPRCGAPSQPADHCERCGVALDAADLVDPVCRESGERAVRAERPHWLLRLSDERLTRAVREAFEQVEISCSALCAQSRRWLDEGPRDLDISREAPCFGFAIPGAQELRFYVWFDALLSYVACARAAAKAAVGAAAAANGESDARLGGEAAARGAAADEAGALAPEDLGPFAPGSGWRVEHFVGKDIAHFHVALWPALLRVLGAKNPSAVHIHGFATANGQKLSKSRGHGARARDWLDAGLPPEALRYHFFCKADASGRDVDLSADEIAARWDADVVGKLANLASRLAPIARAFGPLPAGSGPLEREAGEAVRQAASAAREAFAAHALPRAQQAIAGLWESANAQWAAAAPWALAKRQAEDPRAREALGDALRAAAWSLRGLFALLRPALPELSAKGLAFCDLAPDVAEEQALAAPPQGLVFGAYEPLAVRLPKAELLALFPLPVSPEPAAGA
jgi:methionyl-tRNA synthetase